MPPHADLLACDGLEGPLLQPTQQIFQRLFRTYGIPERIRSDNGQPFASCALGRLSQLSVWWLRLGIRPELIEPASLHQNGRHERMHKDLKADTTRPAAHSFGAQQRRFDAFRHTFNEVRPHEALQQRRPAVLYARSDRLYLPRLRPITYPEHFEIRRVSTNGGIRWNKRWVKSRTSWRRCPSASSPSPAAPGTYSSARSTWAGSMNGIIAFTTVGDGSNGNTTCHPSGDNTCYPSYETFTRAEV